MKRTALLKGFRADWGSALPSLQWIDDSVGLRIHGSILVGIYLNLKSSKAIYSVQPFITSLYPDVPNFHFGHSCTYHPSQIVRTVLHQEEFATNLAAALEAAPYLELDRISAGVLEKHVNSCALKIGPRLNRNDLEIAAFLQLDSSQSKAKKIFESFVQESEEKKEEARAAAPEYAAAYAKVLDRLLREEQQILRMIEHPELRQEQITKSRGLWGLADFKDWGPV